MFVHTRAVKWSALFNLLAVSLFGATESKTLDELKLGVSTSDIGSRLGWGFWVVIASLLLFVLLALNCAFLTCSRDVTKDNESESSTALKRKRFLSRNKKMQADHMTRLYIEATKPQRTAGLYPDIHSYPAPSYPASTLTTKTADAFPPAASTYTSNGPSVYTVNKTSKGYTIQPSSAAVNIDNRNPELTALGTYGYRSGGVSTYNQGTSADRDQEPRVILNRPDLTSYASTSRGVPGNLGLHGQGTAYQDSQYNFNMNPSTTRVHPQPSYPSGFVVAGGPPGYASLPQQESRNVVANFGTGSTTNIPYGVY